MISPKDYYEKYLRGKSPGQIEFMIGSPEQKTDDELAEAYTLGMRKRFSLRHLIPFAKRCDCDDAACFELEKPGKWKSYMTSAIPAGSREVNTNLFGIGLWMPYRK